MGNLTNIAESAVTTISLVLVREIRNANVDDWIEQISRINEII